MLSYAELDTIANILWEKIQAREKEDKEPQHITYKEAMGFLGVGYDALSRRLKKAGVRTYWFGRGKAFDRKHLNRLR